MEQTLRNQIRSAYHRVNESWNSEAPSGDDNNALRDEWLLFYSFCRRQIQFLTNCRCRREKSCGCQENVDDLAQKAFSRLYKHFAEHDEPAKNPPAFLSTICRNIWLDDLRYKRSRRIKKSIEYTEWSGSPEDVGHEFIHFITQAAPHEKTLQNEIRQIILRCMSKQKVKLEEVKILFYFCNYGNGVFTHLRKDLNYKSSKSALSRKKGRAIKAIQSELRVRP